MSHIASSHGPESVVYEDVPGLELPGGAEVVVAADVDGIRHTHPIPLEALPATLAQLPGCARNVIVFRPTPIEPVRPEVMSRYAKRRVGS